jgi:hypothetical protein
MSSRQALLPADLSALALLSAQLHEPQAFFAAVDRLVQRVIGHRLFTIMRFHETAMEVERVYSDNLEAYPVGGRKKKRGTPWGAKVLDRGELFVARNAEEVKQAFDDHALIFSLGVGAIMNVPISFNGNRYGTMNISHQADWFTDADADCGRAIGALLVPALTR